MPESGELQALTIEEVRSTRASLMAEETGLSYLRRLVQGPLDIVRKEQQLRTDGAASDTAALIEDLADVLADGPRSGGLGRLPQEIEPSQVDPELEAELAALTDRLVGVTDLSDEALAAVALDLAAFERRISDRRSLLHTRIDEFQAELTRRYQTGEASIDSLLA
jgi:hypothetical protein